MINQPRRVVKVVVGRLVLAAEVGGGVRPGLSQRERERQRADEQEPGKKSKK
jgi:hypothetical protein